MNLRASLATITIAVIAAGSLAACGQSPDVTDGRPSDKTSASPSPADRDHDGIDDAQDSVPDDANETSDDNNNGIGDQADATAQIKRQAQGHAKAVRLKVQNSRAPSDREWKMVLKNPDAHKGEYYVVTAQITQFDSATGADTFLADSASHNTTSYGYFEGENTMFTGTAKMFDSFVQDDVIVATVRVDGSFSYDTQIGGNTTVPTLKVFRLHRI